MWDELNMTGKLGKKGKMERKERHKGESNEVGDIYTLTTDDFASDKVFNTVSTSRAIFKAKDRSM